MRINWKQDDDAILAINRLGLTSEIKTVPVHQIDAKKSRHNHARAIAIINQNVDDYSDAMGRGDVFPMIVVARVDGGKQLLIAGGNHRYSAAVNNGVTELDGILVECDSRTFEVLCPALNLYVGQREDRAVRVTQAADAVIRLGITMKAAADDYRVPITAVTTAVAVKKVVIEASRMGVRADDITNGHLKLLPPIMTDAVLLPLAIDLCRTKLNCDEVRVLLKNARDLPTEADRVEAIKEAIQNAKRITVSGRISRQPVRAAVMRSLTTIETAMKKARTLCELQLTKQEASEVSIRLKTMAQSIFNMEAGG